MSSEKVCSPFEQGPSSKAKSSLLTSDKAGWEQYVQVKPDDTSITQPVDFDKSNRNMYWLWSDEQSDLGSLVMFPFEAVDQRKVLYTAKRAQISPEGIIFHPNDKTVLAVIEVYHKPELFIVNDTIRNDLQYLLQYGAIQSISMSLGFRYDNMAGYVHFAR
ncbi:hypothetical protein COOONC_08926 [Cooperia oncophora]